MARPKKAHHASRGPWPDARQRGLATEIEVRAEHQISHARQAVLALARATGFQSLAAHYLATAVSEMAANLVFHSQAGGTISLRVITEADRWGLEAVAIDSGPGIADLDQALQDGFTTRGGLGAGLGGIHRLSDGCEIASDPRGTHIRAWKWQP